MNSQETCALFRQIVTGISYFVCTEHQHHSLKTQDSQDPKPNENWTPSALYRPFVGSSALMFCLRTNQPPNTVRHPTPSPSHPNPIPPSTFPEEKEHPCWSTVPSCHLCLLKMIRLKHEHSSHIPPDGLWERPCWDCLKVGLSQVQRWQHLDDARSQRGRRRRGRRQGSRVPSLTWN